MNIQTKAAPFLRRTTYFIVYLIARYFDKILLILSSVFSGIPLCYFERTYEDLSIMDFILIFCYLYTLFRTYKSKSSKNSQKFYEKTANPNLSNWEKTSAPIVFHWYIIIYVTACVFWLLSRHYILFLSQLIATILMINNDLRDKRRYKTYWKGAVRYIRQINENRPDSFDYSPIRYGILYRDDTHMIPVSFSRGVPRPERILVFDWETEVAPYIEQQENFSKLKMVIECCFCIYVLQTKRYSKDELDDLCIECINRWQYQISTWVYIYLIGDDSEELKACADKFSWMPEVSIHIVQDFREIQLNDVTEHYEQHTLIKKNFMNDADENAQYRLEKNRNFLEKVYNKAYVQEMLNFFEKYLEEEHLYLMNLEIEDKNNWEFVLMIMEIVDYIRYYSYLFNNKDSYRNRSLNIYYWFYIAVSLSVEHPSSTLIEKVISYFEDSPIIFPFGNPFAFLEYLVGEPIDEKLSLEKRERILSYINASASTFYRYIPYQEENYTWEVSNYQICGFFKNIFRLSEPKMAIMAGFDYADMALRFVLYYLCRRKNISSRAFIMKTAKNNNFSMDLQLIGDNIYELAANDITCPIYETVVKTCVKTNAVLKNAIFILKDFLFMEFNSAEMDFSGLVEVLRLFRNATKGHGAITEENQQQIWYALYVLLVILGDMLRIYSFQIKFEKDNIYINYEEDDILYYANDYVKDHNGLPCPLYEATIKRNKENSEQLLLNQKYINYWDGTIWKPSIL